MISSEPLVMVVILNWNGLEDTLACLSSVYATQNTNFRVIVIDNNSAKDELSIIKNQFPEIVPIQSQKNLGFTGGCNLGIEYALQNSAQYIWLLNNDAIVFPNTLGSLIDKMQKDPKIGMISPIMYDLDTKHLVSCGTSLNLVTFNRETIRTREELNGYQKNSTQCLVLSGTALLLRKEMVEKVGILDDRFFAYFEDTDYSIRAVTHGWINSIEIDAKILHRCNLSITRTHVHYYMTRNGYLLILKHSISNNRLNNARQYISRIIRRAAEFKVKGEVVLSITLLSGLWDGITNNYGEWNSERQIPVLISKLILWHPYFISSIIKFGLP